MSRIIQNLEIGLDEDLSEKLQWLEPNYSGFHILKKSLDARQRRSEPRFIYSLEVFGENEPVKEPTVEVERISYSGDPVLIVGSGPAGLFAALRLTERGIPVVLFEQGSTSEKRLKSINRFWRHGELDPLNNIGFGEGGAGLYSDGKLITRIKSKHIPYVMDRLIRFGAPPEIRYLANPHVGSDKIRRLIPKIRNFLLENGAQLHFDTKIKSLLVQGKSIVGLATTDGREFRGQRVILACGHSADEMFTELAEKGVAMEGKSFAVGLRIEHPQKVINEIQYREYASHPKLEAANYKLAHTEKGSQIGVYSFCMCPGGYVLSSATSPNSMVVNGMSNYHRNSPFANAAIVVSVDFKSNFGSDNLFAGLKWRNDLEKRTFDQATRAGSKREIPVQKVTDFISGKQGEILPSSSPSGVVSTRLDELFDSPMKAAIENGLRKFENWMPGFIHPEAQFHGVESRTSCPIRITRHKETLESVSHTGLYPSGEGAGYAGGITSAACDGIEVAEAIVQSSCLNLKQV